MRDSLGFGYKERRAWIRGEWCGIRNYSRTQARRYEPFTQALGLSPEILYFQEQTSISHIPDFVKSR